jgi:hypothetical protein
MPTARRAVDQRLRGHWEWVKSDVPILTEKWTKDAAVKSYGAESWRLICGILRGANTDAQAEVEKMPNAGTVLSKIVFVPSLQRPCFGGVKWDKSRF